MSRQRSNLQMDEPLKGDSFVYALIDPRNNQIRYIGITTKGRVRLNVHMRNREGANLHKQRWIEQLKKEGLSFRVKILEYEKDVELLRLLEVSYIDTFRSMGAKLVNITDGGCGTKGAKIPGARVIDENGTEYENLRQAATLNNMSSSTVQDCASGRTDSAKGKFYYYADIAKFIKAETARAIRLSTPRKNKGSKYSEEKRIKHKNSNLKRRKIIDSEGVIYSSMTEAVEKTGLSFATIQNSLKKKFMGRKLNFFDYEDKNAYSN